jgi:hypothetical protein
MCSWITTRWKPYRIAFILLLPALFSARTCSAIVNFMSCPGTVPQPQITALSPRIISLDAARTLLTVNGNGFIARSEIQWNGHAVETTFIDSRHLQTTITQQTFESFGGSGGSGVLISIMSPGSTSIEGSPNGGSSATLVLEIN